MSVVRKINNIYVIQSLPQGEKQTGTELYDDIIRRRIELMQAEDAKMSHGFFDVKDNTSFIDALKHLQANAPYLPGGLLIHFEVHGSTNQEGLVLVDKSFVGWKELVELVRPINVSTCNKLFITMATCFGRNLYKGVDPFAKSPYQAYVSASREVKTIEVMESFNTLFEILMDCGDLIHSYTEHEKNNSPFFYKDSLTTFEDTIVMYRNGLDTNPEYKERILDHPILQEMLATGKTDQATLDIIIKKAFNEIVKRQADAFNFSNCK